MSEQPDSFDPTRFSFEPSPESLREFNYLRAGYLAERAHNRRVFWHTLGKIILVTLAAGLFATAFAVFLSAKPS